MGGFDHPHFAAWGWFGHPQQALGVAPLAKMFFYFFIFKFFSLIFKFNF
jgi:hypothetical protein